MARTKASDNDVYSEHEAQRRFEAALRGAGLAEFRPSVFGDGRSA
jgi:hypothetical protein